MNLASHSIKNYQFTLIMVLMIMVVGITTMMNMSRAEDPEMHTPSFPIAVVYPGTSPKDMEELVVKPMEAKFYGLSDIKRIKTTIYNGLALLFVEYNYNTDVDNKYQELIREVASLRSNLPDDIYSIEVMQVQPSDVNILQFALISENASRNALKKSAENLKEELEKVKALKNVVINGQPDQLIRVDINPERLSQLNIPINQVAQAIQSEATNIPGGTILAGSNAYNLKTSGNYQSIGDIERTVISSNNGVNIHLRDVATIYPDFAPDDDITRLNGFRALFVNAALKSDENITTAQEEYLQVVEHYKKTLPPNIELILHFDQAENVNKRLSGLGIDFIIAVSLVLITLLPLGLRASAVVMIAIPLSLSMGIIALNALGYSLNQLSIVGFVVALGLLVDDSIVVVENIERWMREGYSRVEASIRGTQQITVAIIGCTATLVIAFSPLMFMPEAAGDFIRSMPVAVICSVIASMIVALTVVPFLASNLLKPHEHPEGNVVLRTFQRIIHSTYAVLLDKALRHPVKTLFIALLIFGGAIALLPVVGFSLFPPSEKPQFRINVIAPQQSSLYYTDSLTRIVEQELAQIDDVAFYASNVGRGNPRIYYNVQQESQRNNFSEVFVQLKPHIKAKRKQFIIDSLRRSWSPYLGAKVEVKDFEQGIPVISPVEVRLVGDNLDTLRRLAGEVEELLSETEGTIYINNPVKNNMVDFKLAIDKEKAASLGVSSTSIDRTVRLAVAGLDVATYSNPDAENDDFKIRLRFPGKAIPDLNVFNSLSVNNLQGTAIPINQLARVEFEASPIGIYHINKSRCVSVNAFVDKGYDNDRIIKAVELKMREKKLPQGYTFQMAGEVESREQSFAGFGTIIMITVFLFIAVLVLEFKTFKSTLIVLSVIPLGIVGAVLALLLTGNTLSFVATIGIVALAGIEVKNTILLVDFTNQLRREGMALNEAIEKAGEIRFLPIILTTLTAIGGLTPIAWSSNPLISPLAIVMIGGLISSTLLSRIVTPVIYKLIPPVVEPEKQPAD